MSGLHMHLLRLKIPMIVSSQLHLHPPPFIVQSKQTEESETFQPAAIEQPAFDPASITKVLTVKQDQGIWKVPEVEDNKSDSHPKATAVHQANPVAPPLFISSQSEPRSLQDEDSAPSTAEMISIDPKLTFLHDGNLEALKAEDTDNKIAKHVSSDQANPLSLRVNTQQVQKGDQRATTSQAPRLTGSKQDNNLWVIPDINNNVEDVPLCGSIFNIIKQEHSNDASKH